MRRVATAVVLAVTSVVLTLLALEVGLRVVGWNKELGSEWMLDSPYLALDDDVIIIPRRLLTPELYQPTAAPLVLAIGDSFTYGFPVDPPDAYPPVLERLLARHGIAVTVRNAGMGDSGPDQQLRLLETRLLPRLEPAVVVWQLYSNDVWDNLTKSVYRLVDDRLVPVSGADHWIARRQRIFDRTPLPAAVKKNSRVFRLLLRFVERHAEPRPPENSVDWAIAKISHELDEIQRLARVHGFVPYVVLVHPQSAYLSSIQGPWQVMWNVKADQQLAALLQGRPGVIDGYLGADAGDRDFADDGRDAALRGDRHLNEHGYARLAAIVAHRLVHEGVLPAHGDDTRSGEPRRAVPTP